MPNLFLKPGDSLLEFLGHHYGLFRWFVAYAPNSIISWWAELNAWRAFWHAKIKVPAYAEFYLSKTTTTNGYKEFASIPETDKDTYIRAYTTEMRCRNGVIPFRDTVVDESSGSSGTPYNWVRSLDERLVSHTLVSHFARYCFGTTRFFTINAFSMGSWATGLNMGLALQKNGLVKNIGPDVDKILHTLEFWGANYTYVICGYPPFLKYLIDVAEERSFPLKDFTLYGLVGGEGMSEGLRDYLLKHFEKVYSGYGATDLEIGIAGETPLSVAIRREARKNDRLRQAFFGEDSRLPMLFQYNPLMHYIEINPNGELVFTITRLNILSPRIRYNIHDEGGVMRFADMIKVCEENGFNPKELLGSEFDCMPRLPYLWVYGRKDSTISIMGANIYPEDIEQCLYEENELAKITKSFCIGLHEEENSEVRPSFSFEVTCEITGGLQEQFRNKIVQRLVALNQDFKEAWHEHQETLMPVVALYSVGEGPFEKDSKRIKQVRIVQ